MPSSFSPFIIGSLAAMCGGAVAHPFDVVKVRLQVRESFFVHPLTTNNVLPKIEGEMVRKGTNNQSINYSKGSSAMAKQIFNARVCILIIQNNQIKNKKKITKGYLRFL